MLSLAQKIRLIYPDASPVKDFLVRDDADERGQYIAEWNMEFPIPTDEELAEAESQYVPPVPPKTIEEVLQENADLSYHVMILEGEQIRLKQEQADLTYQLMMKEVI